MLAVQAKTVREIYINLTATPAMPTIHSIDDEYDDDDDDDEGRKRRTSLAVHTQLLCTSLHLCVLT